MNTPTLLPQQIFFHPTQEFLDWVKEHSRSRSVVDCGAGVGRLSKKLKDEGMEVISIDTNEREDTEVPILHFDATRFPFTKMQTVILARPCHGPWIQDTISKALKAGAQVLYVSKPKNIENDLEPEWISKPVLKCCGSEGEVAILIGQEKETPMEHFYLVKRVFCDDKFFEPEWRTKMEHQGMEWWGSMAGGRCPTSPKDIILEEVDAESYEELDHTKTYLNMPHKSVTAGWLDRDGKMYRCESQHHDIFADLILHHTVRELEDTGWCRVYGNNSTHQWTCHERLSAPQRNYLSTHEFNVREDD